MRNSIVFGLLGLMFSWVFKNRIVMEQFYLAVIVGILLDIYVLLKARYKH